MDKKKRETRFPWRMVRHFQQVGIFSKERDENNDPVPTEYGMFVGIVDILYGTTHFMEEQGKRPSFEALKHFRDILKHALEHIENAIQSEQSERAMEVSKPTRASKITGKLCKDINSIAKLDELN